MDFVKRMIQKKSVRYFLIGSGIVLFVIASNLFLQYCQNNRSWELAFKFAFSWHQEKFFLGSGVLLLFLLFWIGVSGSIILGGSFYGVFILLLGFADYQKMFYREEPIYPDDFKMLTELGLIREMIGLPMFLVAVLLAVGGLALLIWGMVKSLHLSRQKQLMRLGTLLFSLVMLGYVSNFNNPNNLLRRAYNRSALWIPYSQKMNYYNTGFIGGFLYNLKVEPMDQPSGYSKEAVLEITDRYQAEVASVNQYRNDSKPNIVFIMSESFSDPLKLAGLSITGDPLSDYRSIANETYSGQMLSQNYGGGTANIEFEALTGFSMELLNPQMTTPYTMLVPKMTEIPSIVSLLKGRGYQATAIHPYNTSMYKRKSVYQILGFDDFLYEDTMENQATLGNNPYISDEAAYQEVLTLLEDTNTAQFIHLVTMQTHMPYADKYPNLDYSVTGDGNLPAIENYLQDIAYSSQALKGFLQELRQQKQQTLVVFWGDHLPSLYSDSMKAANQESALHETEFLIWDSKKGLTKQTENDVVTSPFYFSADLFEQARLTTTGFYQLLVGLQEVLPAFEKGFYYQDGQWQSEISLSTEAQEIYDEYQMIQYDVLAGEGFSMATNFFKE